MIFPILTLLTSLILAGVAGWFSIAGLVTIFSGQPIPALILGTTLEIGKLVTASWLYRNWKEAPWSLKAPLLYFMTALMLTTSMGVFGFLSKAHLEQGAGTLDNSAKIAEIDRKIDREKTIIADNDKMIAQLDSSVNSFLAKEQTNRALAVKRSQSGQRNQLKADSDQAQKRIDQLSEEKFTLESDLRKLELEVGPLKYIATLIYGNVGADATMLESAVRIFTSLVVSTLDPLAITLLIAANFTLVRIRENTNNTALSAAPTANFGTVVADNSLNSVQVDTLNKEHPPTTVVETDTIRETATDMFTGSPEEHVYEKLSTRSDTESADPVAEDILSSKIPDVIVDTTDKDHAIAEESTEELPQAEKEPDTVPGYEFASFAETEFTLPSVSLGNVKDPSVSRVEANIDAGSFSTPTAVIEDAAMRVQSDTLRELLGIEYVTPEPLPGQTAQLPAAASPTGKDQAQLNNRVAADNDKYHKVQSWLTSFKR